MTEDRKELFDRWATDYDATVAEAGPTDFPFVGYEQVLEELVRWSDVHPHMRVLDLGVGTGNLAARFLDLECEVVGLDFSDEMLGKTRLKFPTLRLVQADLLHKWPAELDQAFDRVVSAYVFHEFDLSSKMMLLQRLTSRHLSPDGSALIADIAFPTSQAREAASRRWARTWDPDEYYWAADETIALCKEVGLGVRYKQVSSCAGIFNFTANAAG